jgi:Fe-S cluster biogenesis protein NfuA
MTQVAAEEGFQNQMRQLEGLLRDVEAIADPLARAKTGQVIQDLLAFHGAGLGRIIAHLAAAGAAGRAIVEDLAGDEVVASLLLLYGLHPQDLETRVRAALAGVRPYAAGHGGNVELLEITAEGVVRLEMQGSCHGCPSSAATLKGVIEQAILEKAPDAGGIEVEGMAEPAGARESVGFVPVEQLTWQGGKSFGGQAHFNKGAHDHATQGSSQAGACAGNA